MSIDSETEYRMVSHRVNPRSNVSSESHSRSLDRLDNAGRMLHRFDRRHLRIFDEIVRRSL
jgi:hypothetical protein